MDADLAVLVPSRGRPHNLARLAEAFQSSSTGRAALWVIVDDDEIDAYTAAASVAGILGRSWFTLLDQSPARLGPTLNRWGPQLAQQFPYVGFMGDDHLPRTRGWDEAVLAALTAQPNTVVYGNDLIHGPGLPTAAFMDAAILTTLGYMVPPGLIHLRMDDYWRDLGNCLGTLTYLPGTVIEHMHPIAGKGDGDETYTQANAAAVWDADTATYERFKGSGHLAVAVARVQSRRLSA